MHDSAVSSTWRNYGHDARGNVTSDGRYNFSYDAANQPVSIGGATSGTYTYDGNLKRVKQVVGGETIYSIYDKSGTLVTRDNVTRNEKTDYISLAGQTFVRLKNGVATYPLNDHLGTAMMEADQNGSVPANQVYNYTPWGEIFNVVPFGTPGNDPGSRNEQGFTGHIDDMSGLVYMQARYYDPVIGRFLSTDPIGYADQLNLYAYVRNDPVNLVDHSGQYAELSWTSSNSVTLTIPYKIDSSLAKPGFTKAGLEARVARDYSGTFNVNGSDITITARAIEVSGTAKTNTLKIYPTTQGVTQSGRAATMGIGGDLVKLGAKDLPNVASHELGHTAGAGDQYAGGHDAAGNILSADVPGAPNIMRDSVGGANNQTAGEIINAPTNTNNSANGMSSGIYRICSGMGAQAGGCN